MPQVIRQVMSERLLRSERLQDLLRDFSQVTGLSLRLATTLGTEIAVAGSIPEPEVCNWMREPSSNRRKLCMHCIQNALGQSGDRAATLQCPAGLREIAVPLKAGTEVVGYLLLGQISESAPNIHQINKWRHNLERADIRESAATLQHMLEKVPVQSAGRFQQSVRLAEWLAHTVSALLGENLLEPKEKLPVAITKACAHIRTHFKNEIKLSEVARIVNLSKEHFCSLFHKSTGMRFTEYINRIRVAHAIQLLAHGNDPITEIALESGFQSVPHFNRSFKAITGMSPREYRKSLE